MGGELEIVATFPDGKVRVTQFQEEQKANVDEPEAELVPS